MLSMLLILACTNAGAGGKTSTEVRLRIIAESLTTPGHSEPFSTEARIDETAKTITVFIPELDEYSQSMDYTDISLRVDLPMGYEFELTDGGGAQHTSSDQDTPVSLPMVDLSDSGSFVVTQAGNSVTYTVSAFEGIPIFTEDDLRGIQNIQDDMQKNYFLMNNITLTGNFEPLGSLDAPFLGILDGREKTINNFKIVQSTSNIGFFSQLGNADTPTSGIHNLVLVLANGDEDNPSIEGKDYVGALAAESYGTIKNVAVIGGVVKGEDQVGGLVGLQSGGSIETSYATGTVTGTSGIGGLVGGKFDAKIENSYATGRVEGNVTVGGLVGWQNDKSIENSYATGTVSGTSNVGGLVGLQDAGTITSSYFDAILTTPDGQTTLLPGISNVSNSPGVVTAFYTVDGVVRNDNNATADAVTSDDFSNWDPDIWQWQEGEWPTLYWQNQ